MNEPLFFSLFMSHVKETIAFLKEEQRNMCEALNTEKGEKRKDDHILIKTISRGALG